ncbi:25134_t:CDS:2, partial [Dentiscutata erythropus]
NPETGLMHLQIYDFMDKKPDLRNDDIWFKDFVPEFKVVPLEELPSGVEYGVSYITICLNVQKYLQWLLDQFIANGRKRKKVHLSHLNESFFADDEIDVTISVWAPHIKTVHILTKLILEDRNLQIIRHNVRRRPYRENGIRLEVEIIKNATNKDVIIFHNYRHHSYGYSSSWGSCQEAFKLIEENIQRKYKS